MTSPTRARSAPVLALVLALAAAGCGGGNPVTRGGGGDEPAPAICPLTGQEPESGEVPDRPALAVKVENLPAIRPQIGLSHADLIYEQPVEGGITRFIVVYQCKDAKKIMPIRSARLTDPAVLAQLGEPLFAYAGAVAEVVERVREAGLVDVNFSRFGDAYERDPSKSAPHNLFSSTARLYRAAGRPRGAPEPLFEYSEEVPKGKRARRVRLPFSFSSDVVWQWDASRGEWLRFHGDEAHTYSDGNQVGAENVVVQLVKVVDSGITDVAGAASPEVVSTGSGKAFILRDGRLIAGRWERPSAEDLTRFVDRRGEVIPLRPGNTWVELLPNDKKIERS